MSTVGVIAAVVVLVASIMLHEAGHFLTAKHHKVVSGELGPRMLDMKRAILKKKAEQAA